MNIKETAVEIHQTAKEKGFYDNTNGERNVAEMLMLTVSELSEALEADRKGKVLKLDTSTISPLKLSQKIVGEFDTDMDSAPTQYEVWVKGSFEEEIADAVIRLFDLAEYKGIDLEWHIRAKMEYNKTRAYKHGKKY